MAPTLPHLPWCPPPRRAAVPPSSPRAVTCPDCGAPIGSPCTSTISGRVVVDEHGNRITLARLTMVPNKPPVRSIAS